MYAAHELPAPRLPPQTVDSHLQDHIFQKIQKMTSTIRREDLRPWQTAINTLTVMFSQWPNWRKVIDMILAHKFTNHQQEEKHILICYYKWTDEPILVNSQGHEISSKNYCWGHATDPRSALQIALAGGIRPASTVDENNAIYHWCPSFYCRIDGSLDPRLHHQRSICTTEHQYNHPHEKILADEPQTFHLPRNWEESPTDSLQSSAGWSGRRIYSFSLLRHYPRPRSEMVGKKSPCSYNGLCSLDDGSFIYHFHQQLGMTGMKTSCNYDEMIRFAQFASSLHTTNLDTTI